MPGKVLNSDRKHIQKDGNYYVVTILYALEYYLFLNCILFAFSFTLFIVLSPVFALQEETESSDNKTNEQMKKPKGAAPQTRQKTKKESKKKR